MPSALERVVSLPFHFFHLGCYCRGVWFGLRFRFTLELRLRLRLIGRTFESHL
jgi:hypothetical protein